MKNNILSFVVFAFLITPTVYAQDDDALEREVEMNESAGEGDIEEQTQTDADGAVLLNVEAEVIELENEETYKMLYGEDEELRIMQHVEPPPEWEWCSVECKSNPEGAQVYIIPLFDWEKKPKNWKNKTWLETYRKGDTPVVWESARRQKYRAVFILGERIETRPIDVFEKDISVEVIF